MIPQLGRGLVLLSLLFATAGALLGFATGRRPTLATAALVRKLAYGFAASMILANVLMLYALLAHDFSVSYVAQVGSRLVPTWVSVVSLWSSLEGSILFWGLVLAVFVAGSVYSNRNRHLEYMNFATAVFLACAAFFCFLIAGPAQPFHTVSPVPPDGPGPNPLLQNHVLMAIHPPFLYLGYVGTTISFGLAAAALFVGRLGPEFLKTLRSALLLPWIFQTCAIVLGGWWAYEVLGWGGYWAWDPVENASFLPWLTATAALHSALLLERKGALKGWTLTLVMATFLLTILGTFMTRSGVFNSVHSFTQSPLGPTLLAFLAAALLFTVVLLALRVDLLQADRPLEGGVGRDAAFLVNNLLLVLMTFTVLVGTVFPLIVEALKNEQMSVGRPYFDRMAVPIGAALLFLMGVGPALPWGRSSGEQVKRSLLPPLVGALILAAVGFALGTRHPWTLVTLAFGGYALQVTLHEQWLPIAQRLRRGESFGSALQAWRGAGQRRFGAYVVHLGAAVLIIAIAVSSSMGTSTELQVKAGESVPLGRFMLTFVKAEALREPHRQSVIAHVKLTENGREVATLRPRMNQYDSQREPIGTPDVKSFVWGDVYLSLLNIAPDGKSLGLHAFLNPMVGWIWAATAVMALGGLMAWLPWRTREAA